MKAQDFIEAIGEVKEEYVEETLKYKKANSKLALWRGIAIAACVLLAASVAFGMMNINSSGTRTARTANVEDLDNYYYMVEDTAEEGGYYEAETAAAKAVSNAGYEAAGEEVFFELEDMGVPLAAPGAGNRTGTMSAAYDAADGVMEETAMEAAMDDQENDAAAWDQVTAGDAQTQASDKTEEAKEKTREKKIIYNVCLDMQTREFDDSIKSMEALVDELGGYCEDQYVSNASKGYRYANYTLRIPADKLDEFMERAGQVCTVTYSSKNAQDVSDSYYDIQSRLSSARTKLERLQELMREAENMEDLISIESAITDVEWELDNYGSSLKNYDSRVQYSTVTLNINEVYEVVVEDAPLTFGERISSAFKQGMRSIGMFFKNLIIWLAASWIWLIIIAVVAVVIVVLIRKAVKKRRSKRAGNNS